MCSVARLREEVVMAPRAIVTWRRFAATWLKDVFPLNSLEASMGLSRRYEGGK